VRGTSETSGESAAAGVVFGLVQVLTYYIPYPPGTLEAALGLTGLLAVGNLVVWRVLPHVQQLQTARRDLSEVLGVRRLGLAAKEGRWYAFSDRQQDLFATSVALPDFLELQHD
jgi:hypothetical protein